MRISTFIPDRARRGFTLVELLVVVAIISVLAGMLLPALQKAYDSARIAQCASNLKQLSVAFTQYCGDNNDWLPPTWMSGNYEWKLLVGKNYLEVTPSAIVAPCVFTCPSGATAHAQYRPNCYKGYGMNGAAGHYSTTGVFDYTNRIPKISSPRVPSQALLCSDGSWCVPKGNIYVNQVSPSPGAEGYPEFIHQNRINLAFMDAHVMLVSPLGFPTDTSDASGGRAFWLGK